MFGVRSSKLRASNSELRTSNIELRTPESFWEGFPGGIILQVFFPAYEVVRSRSSRHRFCASLISAVVSKSISYKYLQKKIDLDSRPYPLRIACGMMIAK